MSERCSETGAVLVTTLLLGVLLSLLGGVAVNFAVVETEASRRQILESSARLLAESGVEQAIAWFNQAQLPGHEGIDLPVFAGTAASPDISYDVLRTDDDSFLNDPGRGAFRTLSDLGRIDRVLLYAPTRPEGLCTVEVTSRVQGAARRSVSLELGASRIAPLLVAIQVGRRTALEGETPRVLAHWGPIRLSGDVHVGRSDLIPRKSAGAAVTGLGYAESGAAPDDRWVEVYVGGRVQFDDAGSGLPSNVHPNQDPAPGLAGHPWQYQKFKELAMKSGSYYVPDHLGRLYRNGVMDPALARTPDQVIGEGGLPVGPIFVDTLDQRPPSPENLSTLVLNSPHMDGVLFINAHVVLNPEGTGRTISALSPPSDGTTNAATRVPVTISGVTIHGVLHVAGTVHTDRNVRIFGSLMAERGLTGGGVIESWYNYDLGRGLFRGLPVVFPLSGSWREWGS